MRAGKQNPNPTSPNTCNPQLTFRQGHSRLAGAKHLAVRLRRVRESVLVVFLCVLLFPHPVQSQVLKPRFSDSKSFVQIFCVTALLGDSSMIQIQFALTNLGISNKTGANKILYISNASKAQCLNKKYSRKEWSYQDSASQSLRMGTNQIQIDDDRTTVSINYDEIKTTITFNCLPRLLLPPDSAITVNGRYFEYAILIPWVEVQTVLTSGGAAQQQLNGYAMMEVLRSTAFPTDICRGWITFRGYDEKNKFLAKIRLLPATEAAVRGWEWEGSDNAPVAINNLLLEPEGQPEGRQTKQKLPLVKKFFVPDKGFSITPQRLLYRYSFIDELGPILGTIVKLIVGEPVTYYYRAEAQISNGSTIPGILEYLRIE